MTENKWLPIEQAPRDGTPVAAYRTVRFMPYKPAARKQGYPEGRWQEFNGYGWENCKDDPVEYMPLKDQPHG